MASRRDELRAHQFLKQRAVSALVVRQTDPEQPPFRRPTLAAYWGVALALLGLALAGVIGVFSGGSKAKLEAGKTVIVEKGTGARFVFLGGQLHPVSNYSSALLALGQHVETQTVSSQDLSGVPRGTPLGIKGAPDALPQSTQLLRGGWSMCSRLTATSSGHRVDQSTLLIGAAPAGGAAATSRAVLASVVATGREYLIWHGYRHELSDPSLVSAGLGLASEPVVSVAAAWIDVLPAGVPVATVSVPGAGGPSDALPSRPGTRAGEVFVVEVSPQVHQYFLARADRLVPITAFQLAIQLATPTTALAYGGRAPRPISLDAAEVTLADQSAPTSAAVDLPATRPAFAGADPDAAVCATFAPGDGTARVSLGSTVPTGVAPPVTADSATADGAPLADRVVVPPGHGALVAVVANATAPSGTLALVTDDGQLFPLASREVASVLGYAGTKPVRTLSVLAARLPVGPSLDSAQARQPQ